jgi:uncharacterized protein (TIGR04255 family)
VCEFRFGKGANWDMTTPGIIYNEVRPKFPHKESHVGQEVKLSPDNRMPGAQVKSVNFARFLADDKKTLMQLGDGTLLISRLNPYTTWQDFKNNIEYALNALKKNVELNSIQRIGLRYLNRIEVPEENPNLEKYFEFRPFLGLNLPKREHNSFIVGCIFPIIGDRESCKIELTTAVPEGSNASAFTLDLDYSMTKPESIQFDQSLEWIEEAHEGLERFFEGCITQPLRDLFDVVV